MAIFATPLMDLWHHHAHALTSYIKTLLLFAGLLLLLLGGLRIKSQNRRIHASDRQKRKTIRILLVALTCFIVGFKWQPQQDTDTEKAFINTIEEEKTLKSTPAFEYKESVQVKRKTEVKRTTAKKNNDNMKSHIHPLTHKDQDRWWKKIGQWFGWLLGWS